MSKRPIRVERIGDDGTILVAGTSDVSEARKAAGEWLTECEYLPGELTAEDIAYKLRDAHDCWWRWVPTGPHDWSGEGYARMLMHAEPHARGAFPGVTFG